MKTIPAKRYRMMCLTAMLSGNEPTPAIVTVKNDAEAIEMQTLFVRAWNPQPYTAPPSTTYPMKNVWNAYPRSTTNRPQ